MTLLDSLRSSIRAFRFYTGTFRGKKSLEPTQHVLMALANSPRDRLCSAITHRGSWEISTESPLPAKAPKILHQQRKAAKDGRDTGNVAHY